MRGFLRCNRELVEGFAEHDLRPVYQLERDVLGIAVVVDQRGRHVRRDLVPANQLVERTVLDDVAGVDLRGQRFDRPQGGLAIRDQLTHTPHGLGNQLADGGVLLADLGVLGLGEARHVLLQMLHVLDGLNDIPPDDPDRIERLHLLGQHFRLGLAAELEYGAVEALDATLIEVVEVCFGVRTGLLEELLQVPIRTEALVAKPDALGDVVRRVVEEMSHLLVDRLQGRVREVE